MGVRVRNTEGSYRVEVGPEAPLKVLHVREDLTTKAKGTDMKWAKDDVPRMTPQKSGSSPGDEERKRQEGNPEAPGPRKVLDVLDDLMTKSREMGDRCSATDYTATKRIQDGRKMFCHGLHRDKTDPVPGSRVEERKRKRKRKRHVEDES